MKVKDLISILSKYDENAEIRLDNNVIIVENKKKENLNKEDFIEEEYFDEWLEGLDLNDID